MYMHIQCYLLIVGVNSIWQLFLVGGMYQDCHLPDHTSFQFQTSGLVSRNQLLLCGKSLYVTCDSVSRQFPKLNIARWVLSSFSSLHTSQLTGFYWGIRYFLMFLLKIHLLITLRIPGLMMGGMWPIMYTRCAWMFYWHLLYMHTRDIGIVISTQHLIPRG